MSSRLPSEARDVIAFITGTLHIASAAIVVELAARALNTTGRSIRRAVRAELDTQTRAPYVARVTHRQLGLGLNNTASARRVLTLTSHGQRRMAEEQFSLEPLRGGQHLRKATYIAMSLVLQHVARGAVPALTGYLGGGVSRHGDTHRTSLPSWPATTYSVWNSEPWALKLVGGDLAVPLLVSDQSILRPRLPEVWWDRLSFTTATHVRFNGWGERGPQLVLRHGPKGCLLKDVPGYGDLLEHRSVAAWDSEVIDTVRQSLLSWEQWAETLTTIAFFARLPIVPWKHRSGGRIGTPSTFREAMHKSLMADFAGGQGTPSRRPPANVAHSEDDPSPHVLSAVTAPRARAVHAWSPSPKPPLEPY